MDLPHSPGCYLHKDRTGKIIYVGKAKDLFKRVSSYFNRNDLDAKIAVLVAEIADTDFIVTDNEIEALVLENNLIKKHQPKYNINLKDAKRYAYIEITKEEFPRLLVCRQRMKDGSYFGPFTSAATRDIVLSTLLKTLKFKRCKKMPKKACLRSHIDLCDAPCAGNISATDYKRKVDAAEMVLSGKTDELLDKLKEELLIASKDERYEDALRLRDEISSFEWLSEKQKVERQKKYNEDILNYLVSGGKVYLMLFNINKGCLENKQEFVFDYRDNFFDEFILQYYSENEMPKEIIIPAAIDESLVRLLQRNKVKAVIPQKGEKRQLLELVLTNIKATFFSSQEKLVELQEKLKLPALPNVIECFDISHLSGTSTVGSMVQFREGRPDKNNYRRFKIKTVEGVDDFECIAEVVRRRYSRLALENKPLPDLIMIDGGKGQLSSALAEMGKLGLNVPMIALAKKEEEIYFPGLSIPIKIKGKGLRLLQEIRDEAHRFAIKYNRLLRIKAMKE